MKAIRVFRRRNDGNTQPRVKIAIGIAGAVVAAICVALSQFGIIASAETKVPRWFAAEAVGHHEHLLTGSMELNKTGLSSISLYLGEEKGVEEEKLLADGCNSSKMEGVEISEGEPGKVKIGKLTIGGCSESLSEPCTIKSTSESITRENIKGELVYISGGSSVGVLFKPIEFTFNIVCPCKEGPEKFKLELLPHEGPTFAYSADPDFTFDPLFLTYNNAAGESKEIHSEATGVVTANRVGYEYTFHGEDPEPPTSENAEVKAE